MASSETGQSSSDSEELRIHIVLSLNARGKFKIESIYFVHVPELRRPGCGQLLLLLPHTLGAVGVSNEEFIMMHFPKDNFETEIVWLLGNYLHVAEAVAIGNGKKLRPDHLKGVLRNRLLVMKNRAVIRPNLVL